MSQSVGFIHRRITSNAALRRLLRPLLDARASRSAKQFRQQADLLDRLVGMLEEDPPLRVPEFDGIFRIDRRSDLFKRLIIEGSYETELAHLARKWTVADRDVIDVGANIGFFSVLAAKSLGTGRVLAIEPTPTAALRLRGNLARNGVEAKVTVFEGAASSAPGAVEIHYIEGREEYSSLGRMDHPAVAQAPYSTTTVQSKRIDDLVEELALRPALVKIDVEGMEHVVLAGAESMLSEHRPVVICELSDPLLKKNGSSAAEVIAMFVRQGYTVTDPLAPSQPPGTRPYGDLLCLPPTVADSSRP
jgi:FkbM family methyltransferase